MKLTTLCYIENDKEQYLMLHRTKKLIDPNKGKWIGVGGHFEKNETPEECVIREAFEETNLTLDSVKLRCVATFISDTWENEYMFIFTSNDYSGELKECPEGDLQWIDKKDIMSLNLWEGDKIFLKELIENDKFFTLKLEYKQDELINHVISYY